MARPAAPKLSHLNYLHAISPAVTFPRSCELHSFPVADVLLTDFLTLERIRVPLVAQDKPAVLRELTELLVEQFGGSLDDVLAAVEERERALSTGIGFGVAIPHGRSPSIPNVGLVCGLAAHPISFDAVDGEPVRLVFLMAGPEVSAGQHVKVLSRIARLVRREDFRAGLMNATTPEQLRQAILQAEEW